MKPYKIPVTKCDADDPGQDIPVTAAGASVSLPSGLYKLAAIGGDLRWRLGASVTSTTGSFLGAKDQELVHVPGFRGSAQTLYIVKDPDGDDGRANIVPVVVFEIPEHDARNYRS